MISYLEKRLLILASLNDLPVEFINEDKLLRHIVNGNFSSIISNFLDDAFCHAKECEKQSASELATYLVDVIYSFISARSDRYNEIDILCVGIACLYAFVQCNWTGPSTFLSDDYVVDIMKKYCQNNDDITAENLKLSVRDKLANNDDELISHMYRFEFLMIAECIFKNIHTVSSPWWLLRAFAIHQRSVVHPSSNIHDNIASLINNVETNLENMDDKTLQILFSLEIIEIYTRVYSNFTKAQKHLQQVLEKLELDICSSGVLGKRTRFQTRDLPQLVLKVKFKGDTKDWADNHLLTYKETPLPKDIQLNDDVRLPNIHFANADNDDCDNVELNILHQSAILALHAVHFRTKPKDNLSIEELSSSLMYLLNQRNVWSLHISALQFRSFLEANDSRAMERALSQLGSLLDATEDTKPHVLHRLLLFHCSHMSPKWKLKEKSGDILMKLGAVKSALDIFIELQVWEHLVECYNSLNLKHKAAEVLRDQLEKGGDTVRIWCLLGDATDDESCYSKAWQLSRSRSWLAQKHWGLFYFRQKQYAESICHLEQSLKMNSLQVQLWSYLGYANLMEENWEQCACAYRRYCSLEPESFEAWNNLSKAYIKLGQKERALRTLQEAVKFSYDNWKIWENLLIVSTDCKDFSEAIRCYDRLLDLKEKYLDLEILEILVNQVASISIDNRLHTEFADLIKNALTLFGKLTSRVISNAKVWHLYATLTEYIQTEDKNEKVLNYLQKAHNIENRDLAWKRSVKDCADFLTNSLKLAKAYEGAKPTEQNLNTEKMMLRGVISLVKKEYTSPHNEQLHDELCDKMTDLETTLSSVQLKLSKFK